MKTVRFVLIGGFLGAGKTTTIARLARTLMAQGKRVGIVTNDQADDLVDTNNLRSQGFSVQEVPGACFCCKFDELIDRAAVLDESERPDVILAEPVGSCTDLVATVVQPLRDLYAGRFTTAPFPVLFKPSHGLKILRNESSGFSPKAAYIFRKQLEEADAIVVNRSDELTLSQSAELKSILEHDYPGTPVLFASAKTGTGFDALSALLEQEGAFGQKILEIDYDTYAEGEAELGWYNGGGALSAPQEFAIDDVLLDVIGRLQEGLAAVGGEAAHLKVIGLDDQGGFGVANLVSSVTAAELSLPSGRRVKELNLVVNARAAVDPAQLEEEVHRALSAMGNDRGISVQFGRSRSFRPGRPQPTHRYAAPA